MRNVKGKTVKRKIEVYRFVPAKKAKSKYYYVYRSSVTGRMVTEKYAKCHPKTTERERRTR